MLKEQLEAENAEQQAERASELSMQAAAKQEEIDNTIIDLSGIKPIEEVKKVVEDDSPTREVRMKHTADQMTYGRKVTWTKEIDTRPDSPTYGKELDVANLGGPNYLTLEEGRLYRLPRHLADHLDERGFILH